jgi:hypothetical protein
MGAGIGQDRAGALIKSVKYYAAIARYLAVANTFDSGALPAFQGQDIIGFGLVDGKAGEANPVHISGGVALAIASGAITKGQHLITETSGKLSAFADGTRENRIVEEAISGSSPFALSQPADALLSAVGTITTLYDTNLNVGPRGAAPSVTKRVALSSDNLTVVGYSGDALTGINVTYLRKQSPMVIVAVALADAQANDVFPVLPVRFSIRN